MVEVRECSCGWGLFRKGVELKCARSLTRFLCGDISSLIRAHLFSVFSLLRKTQNTLAKFKIGFEIFQLLEFS